MLFKHKLVTTLLVVCCISVSYGRGTTTYCSLDIMKKIAMKACEHIFEAFDDERPRRSVDYEHMTNDANPEVTKYYHYVRRSIFPPGGYLKVGAEHYHKLTQLDVSPRYKAKKLSHLIREGKKMRYSRNTRYGSNISYCCYKECDEQFFC